MSLIPTLLLKPEREKSVRQQHPWIFSGAVARLPQAENGDIVAVCQADGRFLGYGFFDPESQIVVRLFAFGKEPFALGEAFWQEKIARAFQLRQSLRRPNHTNAYRLLHAEGDFLPGIIADVYDQTVVLQLLIRGTEKILPMLLQALHGLGFRHFYLKNKENPRRLEGTQLDNGWLEETGATKVDILENQYRFQVDIAEGQKTGFFLDQRDNRTLLGHTVAGSRVLNAFAYTGGFSVYALGGQAQEVVSVDISKEAIRQCEANVALNFGPSAPHTALAADCFEYLKNTSERFDRMVLDPPAFAKSKKAVARAARGYISLNELGLKKLCPGGLLFTFSCSGSIDRDTFRKMVFAACAEVGREVRILYQLSQPADHPVNIYHPEGEYLKGLVLQVS
ncbi:MAG: class I SAM-dependent rRNA methyltransferase [Microscillaceae bacterium]